MHTCILHMYIHTCIHMQMCVYIHVYTCIFVYVYSHVYKHISIHAYVYVHTCTYKHIDAYMPTHIHIHTCVQIYAYIQIYTYSCLSTVFIQMYHWMHLDLCEWQLLKSMLPCHTVVKWWNGTDVGLDPLKLFFQLLVNLVLF